MRVFPWVAILLVSLLWHLGPSRYGNDFSAAGQERTGIVAGMGTSSALTELFEIKILVFGD